MFSKGTRVRILHTGELGRVVANLDNGMVKVMLEDGFDIPVFPEDIESMEPEAQKKKKPVFGAQAVEKPEESAKPKRQYTILKSQGVQVGFLPIPGKEGMIQSYDIFLVNDLDVDVVYDFFLSFFGAPSIEKDGMLESMSFEKIGNMIYDQLNDSPLLELAAWPITTAGKVEKHSKELKIKPKTFFTKTMTAPLLDKQRHLFKMFENFEGTPQGKKEEDLRSYTQRKTGNKMPKFYREPSDWLDVKAVAEFLPELDLHIEYLSDDFDKMDNGQKLRLQLNVFDQYLEKAVKLGVPKGFIIHGVGKGKLKDAIATRLIKLPGVKSFKNEFHPKYGWGATEVDLT
ncbi:MAG: Smr/MutS family protein [Saprospiraceae bacterium]|nr:Smr/MutS family protein [Saprospiraceae bacterium]